MGKEINERVGVSCSGFVIRRAGEVIASAETFDKLMKKKSVRKLVGNKSLVIGHVVPPGTIEIY